MSDDDRDRPEAGPPPPEGAPPPPEHGPPPPEPAPPSRWRRRRGARRTTATGPPPSGRWRRRGGARGAIAPGARKRRWARRLGIALGVALIVAALVWITLPDPREYASEWPERTAYMEGWLAGGDPGARSIDYRPVPLSRIPESLGRAVLVSEDAGFYGHGGFDWHEVGAALEEAWKERELPRGASTITQQLARNLYLSPSRNPLRKLREALITRRLESRLPKNRIFELYLNVIELGPGVYGVEAAAHRYFGKPVAALSPREAAELAATIPSPRGNNPSTRTRSFQWRARLAHARAFGGVEIDTLGPPPDTIEVAPPTLPDSLGGPAGDTAADDTLGADTTRADSTRREPLPDDPRGGGPVPDSVRPDSTRPDTTRRVAPGPPR